MTRVNAAQDKSLDLLVRSYRANAHGVGGGWYNRLDEGTPGPTATAVALTMFEMAGRRPKQYEDAVKFLTSRQVSASEQVIDGGWATNTSVGHTVTDATAWILRFLGTSGSFWDPGLPNVERAYRWIIKNANKDGGWGAAQGCPSRIWLTCLCLRAVAKLNHHEPAVDSAVDWLLSQHDSKMGGWGEAAKAPMSLVHSAAALTAIRDCRPDCHDRAVELGYQYLEEALNSQLTTDRYVESYEVSVTIGSRRSTWQNGMLHYVAPVAACALIRHPEKANLDLLGKLYESILDKQLEAGHWPSIHGGPNISIWSVWPFYESLCDLRRIPLQRYDDSLTLLPGTVIIRDSLRKKTSIRKIWRQDRVHRGRQIALRYGATALLGASLIIGLATFFLHWIGLNELLIGLGFPVLLFILQEISARRRKS
ncbi:prenyltransferase/squalene oxidase repeat-containing protein [Amycolatopsis sp. NPDC049252]|uniref:prenyltransferase/squalene oxidase repeat-containing protein n=1 Tax=Amycolatopsis sp. NPDC049252 TaxID=3363933 RepID=UPI00371DBB17